MCHKCTINQNRATTSSIICFCWRPSEALVLFHLSARCTSYQGKTARFFIRLRFQWSSHAAYFSGQIEWRTWGPGGAPTTCGRGRGAHKDGQPSSWRGGSFSAPIHSWQSRGGPEVVVTYLWQARNLLIMVAEEMCRLFRKCLLNGRANELLFSQLVIRALTCVNTVLRLTLRWNIKGKTWPMCTNFSRPFLLLGDSLGSQFGHGGVGLKIIFQDV